MSLQEIANKIIGTVQWQSEVLGYTSCPGQAHHTGRNAARDTRVLLDQVPGVYCLHQSCKTVLDGVNRSLRREIWKFKRGLQGMTDTQIKKRKKSAEDVAMERQMSKKTRLRAEAESLKSRIFKDYRQTVKNAYLSSPIQLDHTPEQDYHLFLDLFHNDDIIWVGNVTDSRSSDPSYSRYFLPVSEWRKASRPIGQFTTGSVFKNGTHSRSNENVSIRRYLVVESDTLSRDDICAVFNWMSGYNRLLAIIDTGGRSLHGWFEMPGEIWMEKLKVMLPILGCDPALFKPSQPVRIPGAKRDSLYQSLIWLNSRRTK